MASYPDLRNKVAVVTGGASNIGRGVVLEFADQGARLVIVDMDPDQAERTAVEVRRRGSEALVVTVDLTDPPASASVLEKSLAEFGNVDILVNNVGWQRPSWFTDIDAGTVARTISLNLGVTIAMCQAFLPHMLARGSGNVVNISSDAAFGEVRQSVYGAAKAGIISLTKALALESGRSGVRVNAVSPGLVTPPGPAWVGEGSLWAGDEPVFDEAGLKAVLKGIPLRRMSDPTDIAAAVLFFASETCARQLTGQVISVSGGYTMPG